MRRWYLLPLLLAALPGSVAAADAPKAEIKSLSVLGVPAGKTSTVIVFGENLSPKSVSVKSPLSVRLVGASVIEAKYKGRGSREVTLEVSVPESAPHATYDLTLMQPDNTAVKTDLCVTEPTAVEIPIKKPASTFATAMPVPGPSAAITGQLDGDSADVVRFDGRAGEVWDITLLSSRGGSLLDPVLRIRDSHHNPLALSAGDKKRDRHIEFRPVEDGVYYAEITEAEARGGAGYIYRLALVRRK